MKNKKRLEIDFSRPLVICKTKEEFDNYGLSARSKSKRSSRNDDIVEVSKDEYNANRSTTQSQRGISSSNQDIIVPRIRVLPLPLTKKKRPKLPSNYIRYNKVYPQEHVYELNQSDLCFCEKLKAAFPQLQITQSFFTEQFIQLQLRCGRTSIFKMQINWERNQYLNQLKQRRPNFGDEILLQIGQMIFNYWWMQRKQFNYPLYRPLWRPQFFQHDELSAFRRREKQTRTLRKSTRIPECETMEELHNDFTKAVQLCSKVLKRENLKLKLINHQFFDFSINCKRYIDPSEDLIDLSFSREIEANEKNYMLEYQKKRKQRLKLAEQSRFDNSLSISYFLSNVIQQAEKKGISHDSLFTKAQQESQEERRKRETHCYNSFKNLSKSYFDDLDSTEYEHRNTQEVVKKAKSSKQKSYFESEQCDRDIKQMILKFANSREKSTSASGPKNSAS